MLTLLLWLLSKQKLSAEGRLKVVNTLIHTAGLPPLTSIIKEEGGQLLIRDTAVGPEERIFLSDAAETALTNQARRIVIDQLKFEAVKLGIHNATIPEHTLFAKVILWVIEKEEEMLRTLRGTA